MTNKENQIKFINYVIDEFVKHIGISSSNDLEFARQKTIDVLLNEKHVFIKGGPYEPINIKDEYNKKDGVNIFPAYQCEKIKELEEYIEELEEEVDKSPLSKFTELFFNDDE